MAQTECTLSTEACVSVAGVTSCVSFDGKDVSTSVSAGPVSVETSGGKTSTCVGAEYGGGKGAYVSGYLKVIVHIQKTVQVLA